MSQAYSAPTVTTLGTVEELTSGIIVKQGSATDSLTPLSGLTGKIISITPTP